MQEIHQDEDYHNLVQCFNDCYGEIAHAQKLYFERYGVEPSLENLSKAVRLHGNNSPTENYEEDADMSTNTEFEIKEEIIIKEEIEIGEECILKTNNSKCNLERTPVVYTTRLDEMIIFKKNFASLTVDDIIENVILESKPKLTKPIQHDSKCISTFDRHPFFKLVDKIRQFNKLVLEDAEEENIPLKLQTSKRVYANINRPVGKVQKQPVRKENKIKQLLKFCRPCSIRLVPSRQLISIQGKSFLMYDVKQNNTMTFVKGVRYIIDLGCVIVFRNLKTKSSEAHIVANEGLFTKTSDTLLSCSQVFRCEPFATYGLDVDVCCWFYRENVLKSLIWQKNMNQNIMRKPHTCPSGRCDCCCKRKNLIKDDDVQEVPVVKTAEASAKLLARQLVRSLKIPPKEPPVKNFVNEALEFTRKEILTNNDNTKTRADLSDVVDDRLGVQIIKDYSDATEFYEIKSDGNIVKHVEIRSQYSHMSNDFRKEMRLNAQSNRVFCCWRKRDTMLQSFELKYQPVVTQFLRTPHPCPPDNCICCCKTSSLNVLKTDDTICLEYKPKHSTNYTSVIKQRRKFHAKSKHVSKYELENVTPKTQGDNTEKSSIECESTNRPVNSERPRVQELDFENFIAGDIIDKTVDSTVKKVTQNSVTGKHVSTSGPSEKVSPNITICETDDALTTQKSVLKKRAEKITVRRKFPQKAKENQSLLKKSLLASSTTQPSQLASRSSVPLQSEPSSQSFQLVRPPLVPQNPGPSQSAQSTITPIQSNIASSQNNINPALNPLANIPLQNEAQDPAVNTLVNSILQKFNDVRLIITPDGDVSAELNMPMKNLTTQELQLLSRILAHAKQQVKALKATGHLNSGTNTVLNPWQTNLGSKTNSVQAPGVNVIPGDNTVPDSNSTPVIIQNTPTAPIVIANTDVQNTLTTPKNIANTDITANEHTSSSLKVPTTFKKSKKINENIINNKARIDAFQCYTNVSALKMKEYLTSCRSYLCDTKFACAAPKIGDVFSLNEAAKKSKTTKNSENVPVSNTTSVKRKSNQKLISDAKKTKTMNVIETIELDDDPLAVEIPAATMMPVLQPSTSTIPITGPVDNILMPAPILSGMLNKPHIVPSGELAANQVYVAVPITIPGKIQPIETLYNSDTSTKDDDCILGF